MAPQVTGAKRYWHLLSRFAAASVVATAISQLVFLLVYALGAAPVVATITAWLAGAIPNFTLNRRTWGSTGRAGLRGEILRYAIISVTTALLAALATHNAETLAQASFPDTRSAQVAVVWGAFLGTYAVMFVIKFFLVDRLVFRRKP
ncbi:Putative flippase GtrA (transmembrane translocase of bactoprenol-linked glucose) [Saccharopolyspora kobensis]|uniref:Flippase GtrA (Transmembrane translocase of bactoprenol-linked glucose) n=1 Tax=Saccharopolyspora kobensis TaxID=146035 RepID=A0A1H6C4M3_9PSEU|nr:GtrA family protein [Saccharopolyspora kobensis]SEG67929.1 Putative flippase GtrA (transmembrane translocase of bactoprenol-linked glucose) [Saccharopolyspora kobensis]SFC28065.1 Putative flippase GtrA (transmembrane translocase of bactoprenol-linked glucose) [Saccharopolyspora kobensis]